MLIFLVPGFLNKDCVCWATLTKVFSSVINTGLALAVEIIIVYEGVVKYFASQHHHWQLEVLVFNTSSVSHVKTYNIQWQLAFSFFNSFLGFFTSILCCARAKLSLHRMRNCFLKYLSCGAHWFSQQKIVFQEMLCAKTKTRQLFNSCSGRFCKHQPLKYSWWRISPLTSH